MAIKDIIQSGANTLLVVTPADLQEFALSVVNEFTKAAPRMEEKRYSRREFARRHGVTLSTLWRWEKQGLLKGIRVGQKVYYRDSDLKEL